MVHVEFRGEDITPFECSFCWRDGHYYGGATDSYCLDHSYGDEDDYCVCCPGTQKVLTCRSVYWIDGNGRKVDYGFNNNRNLPICCCFFWICMPCFCLNDILASFHRFYIITLNIITNFITCNFCCCKKTKEFNKNRASGILYEACKYGDVQMIKRLHRIGLNVNDEFLFNGGIKELPLNIAASYNQLEAIKLLVNLGADVNLKSETIGRTALSGAATNGHIEAMKLLINLGSDITVLDKLGYTLLHIAYRHKEVIEYLIALGLDVNGKTKTLHLNLTPLHLLIEESYNFSSKMNDSESIKTLKFAGANLEIKNHLGFTPLHLACFHLHEEYILLLGDLGANPDTQNNDGNTPLHTIVEKCKDSILPRFVNNFFTLKPDDTIVNKKGQTARNILQLAINQNHGNNLYINFHKEGVVLLLNKWDEMRLRGLLAYNISFLDRIFLSANYDDKDNLNIETSKNGNYKNNKMIEAILVDGSQERRSVKEGEQKASFFVQLKRHVHNHDIFFSEDVLSFLFS